MDSHVIVSGSTHPDRQSSRQTHGRVWPARLNRPRRPARCPLTCTRSTAAPSGDSAAPPMLRHKPRLQSPLNGGRRPGPACASAGVEAAHARPRAARVMARIYVAASMATSPIFHSQACSHLGFESFIYSSHTQPSRNSCGACSQHFFAPRFSSRLGRLLYSCTPRLRKHGVQ